MICVIRFIVSELSEPTAFRLAYYAVSIRIKVTKTVRMNQEELSDEMGRSIVARCACLPLPVRSGPCRTKTSSTTKQGVLVSLKHELGSVVRRESGRVSSFRIPIRLARPLLVVDVVDIIHMKPSIRSRRVKCSQTKEEQRLEVCPEASLQALSW